MNPEPHSSFEGVGSSTTEKREKYLKLDSKVIFFSKNKFECDQQFPYAVISCLRNTCSFVCLDVVNVHVVSVVVLLLLGRSRSLLLLRLRASLLQS